MKKTVIPLSKLKLILLFAASVIFVILGTWFAFSPTSFNKNPALIFMVGVISVAFFGLICNSYRKEIFLITTRD